MSKRAFIQRVTRWVIESQDGAGYRVVKTRTFVRGDWQLVDRRDIKQFSTLKEAQKWMERSYKGAVYGASSRGYVAEVKANSAWKTVDYSKGLWDAILIEEGPEPRKIQYLTRITWATKEVMMRYSEEWAVSESQIGADVLTLVSDPCFPELWRAAERMGVTVGEYIASHLCGEESSEVSLHFQVREGAYD